MRTKLAFEGNILEACKIVTNNDEIDSLVGVQSFKKQQQAKNLANRFKISSFRTSSLPMDSLQSIDDSEDRSRNDTKIELRIPKSKHVSFINPDLRPVMNIEIPKTQQSHTAPSIPWISSVFVSWLSSHVCIHSKCATVRRDFYDVNFRFAF